MIMMMIMIMIMGMMTTTVYMIIRKASVVKIAPKLLVWRTNNNTAVTWDPNS